MKKKYGFFAALVVALLTTALVIGCIAPVDGNVATSGSKAAPVILEPAPAGMGYVQLNFGEKASARATFLPDVLTLNSFNGFNLVFTPVPAATPVEVYIESTELTVAAGVGKLGVGVIVPVAAGDYTLKVTAYMGGNATTGLAAAEYDHGATQITVTDGAEITAVNVALVAIEPDGLLQGSVAWNITNGVNTAGATFTAGTITLTPTPLAGLGTAIGPQTLIGAGESFSTDLNWTNDGDAVLVDSGYYYADLRVTAGTPAGTGTGPIPIINRHIVHIYPGMKTTVTYTFTDGNFGNFTPPTTNQGGVGSGSSFSYTHPNGEPPMQVAAAGSTGVTGDGTKDIVATVSEGPFVVQTGDTVTITVTLGGYDSVIWELHHGTSIISLNTTGDASYAISGADDNVLTISYSAATGVAFKALARDDAPLPYFVQVRGVVNNVEHGDAGFYIHAYLP